MSNPIGNINYIINLTIKLKSTADIKTSFPYFKNNFIKL